MSNKFSSNINNIKVNTIDSVTILPDQSQILDNVFNNFTFLNKVFSFLKNTQDTGESKLPSMDIAYYLGMSLKTLESLTEAPVIYQNNIISIYNKIFDFIETTYNSNGGYSNWFGARSSMESTYQAIRLYHLFNRTSELSVSKLQNILNFINNLKTDSGGYFPLLNWDVPDITSTYRALFLKKQVLQSLVNLNDTHDQDVLGYLDGNFKPQIQSSTGSGYSEVKGGKIELLSSLKAIQTYSLLNSTSSYAVNVTHYLNSLTSLNGGVSGLGGKKATTGFTATAIQLYIELKKYNSFDVDTILPNKFLENSINYLKGNKKALAGYVSSETDSTPELISTFFVIQTIKFLQDKDINSYSFGYDGIYDFILNNEQPTLGFADSPGNNADLSYTSMVIFLSHLLNNQSWINSGVSKFISDSFSPQNSGFGYRPFASPKIKYTYYGIKAMRSISYPLSQMPDITNFILKSHTLEGGFGQFPGAQLSYLSHTYWALSSLDLIGQLNTNNLDYSDILFWLSFLKKDNETYGNSRTTDPSLISTYRALKIKSLLGVDDIQNPILKQKMSSYRLESGGYRNRLDKTVPTMEATYYGVQLALQLNLNVNLTKTVEFILSLHNNDGGFALRPGFSSRVTSTYFALLALKIISDVSSGYPIPVEDRGDLDFYAPIIIPSFIPIFESNKTIENSFKTSAKVSDPETNLSRVWVKSLWYAQNNNTPQINTYPGATLTDNKETYVFIIGPYKEAGFLEFQIFASDDLNNTSSTGLFGVFTSEFNISYSKESIDIFPKITPWIPFIVFSLVLIESIYQARNKRKLDSNSNIKMSLQEK